MTKNKIDKIIAERNSYKGLTSKEAEKLQMEFGFNARPPVKHQSWLLRLVKILGEPMMLLLLVTAAVYFFLGDKLETIILLFTIIPIGLMEFFQEQKTNEAIKALDKMMVQYTEVFRDGSLQKKDVKYLVPGDYVYLTTGDRIPADGILLSSPGLSVDESILTGESISVVKDVLVGNSDNLKDENKLWQGTLVVQGEGYFLITFTGENTAYGKIGNLMEKIAGQKTPLQKKIQHLVKVLAIFAVSFALLLGILLSFRQGAVAGILGALTVAMSLIPEEFPIVFSVFLIMGVWRMTHQKALVREMAMVETLGSATVICTDKTGTLTEGSMSLDYVYYQNNLIEIKKQPTAQQSHLKNMVVPSLLALEQVAIDPIEIEIQSFAQKLGFDVNSFFRERTLLQDSSFESKTKMVHHMWQEADGTCRQYTAGAPESVLACSKLSQEEKKKIELIYTKLADKGCRIIAVAERSCGAKEKIVAQDLNFVGLLGMSDPPREGVKEAVATCQRAGIRIIMITGDNKLTAHSIAEAVGLNHNEEILTGNDLEKMSPTALQEAVKRHDIFTRVHPEQKYLIVKVLQNMGEIVAMTGDGVNDAPALRQANIGLAMGLKGTEVARAAAGIVLMDDNFATIVNAIKEGRRVYDNLRQAFVFLFSFHLPIVGLAILPLLFGQPLVFMPIHIIFLELICDPSAVLGFEREAPRRNLMKQPPTSPQEPLLNRHLILIVLVQGLAILFVSLAFYYYFGLRLGNLELGRTTAFMSLVLSQIFLIIFSREPHQVKSNKLLLAIAGVTFVLICFIAEIPIMRRIFHLTEISWSNLFLVISMSLAVALVLRVLRLAKRKLRLAF